MLYLNKPNRRSQFYDFGEEDETGALNEFKKGVSSGVDQLQGLIGGGGRALVGSAIGDDEMFRNGMEYYNEQMNEAAENAADVGSIEEIEGIGDFVNYSAFVVGNIIPSLIGGGGAGAAVGVVAKRAAMSAAGKVIAKQSAQQLTKKQAATQYARSTVGQEALAKRGLAGQMVGATAFGTAAGAGESFTRIYDETGEEAAIEAMITGVASGALDAMAPMRALKRILPQGAFRDASEEVASVMAKKRGVFKRALTGAGKSSATEGVTEMMQEIVQNAALEVVRGYDPALESSFIERMLEDGKFSQYKNAFVAGAIGGGAMGGITGAVTQDPETRAATVRQEQLPSPEDFDIAQNSQPPEVVIDDQSAAQTAQQRQEEVRARAQGLPKQRRQIPRTDPSAVRAAEQQDIIDRELPNRRDDLDSGEATASRESIQRQIRDQVAGLPAVRENVKKILQEVTDGTYRNEGVGETVTIPAPAPVTPEADAPTEVSGSLPDPANVAPPMTDLIGRDVEYNGNKGLLIEKEDGLYVSTQDNGDVFIESGQNKSPAELGVVAAASDLEFENDFQIDPETKKFTLRGKEYTLTRIVKDKDGNPLSLAVRDAKGKRKTIKEKSVLDRAQAQMTKPPNFAQIKVEVDDLPVDIQEAIVKQSDPENIPTEISAQEALEIAQSMPDADQVATALNESFQLTLAGREAVTSTPMQYSQTITRPSSDVTLTEAIQQINKGQGSNRSSIDESRIDSLFDGLFDGPIVLSDGETLTPVNMLEGINESPDGMSANIRREVKASILDLIEAGMPKSVLKDISGIFIHSQGTFARETDGAFFPDTSALSLSLLNLVNLVTSTENTNNRAGKFRYVMAHELGHAYDIARSLSDAAPEFRIEIDGFTPEGVELSVGSIISELGRNYQNGTELGMEMDYPFGDAWSMLNDNPDASDQIVDVLQKEAFAQGFAVYHASPELLQESAPLTYNYFKKLLQTPAESQSDGQVNTETQEVDAQAGGVRQDVRPQTVSGSEQIQDESGIGEDGGGSAVAQEASEGLGEQTPQEDGDNIGQAVQSEEDAADARAVDQELGDVDDDYDPMDDLASFVDDGSPLFAPFSRVPEPDESSPVLPMGKVEQSLSDLLAENPNPTAEQLGSLVGAPKKRKGKESVQDVDVRPVTLDELRGYVEDSLSKSDNLKWYDDFGNLFRDLVGDANLDEASVIFGITSAQNAAENNLAETLHIMSLARKFDPVKQRKQFELAVKATRRPDGQKLKITGRQVTAISDLYANGDFEGGIKTTTYMQMVADRGRNEYNPFSVQDVHMSRVFGFRKKDFDKKSGALVDAAKVSGENEYRYAQYLTSVLADEFGMTPNQMQATLWFYAKDKLTPKNKGDEDKAKKKLEKLRKKAEAEGKEFDETAPRYGDGTPESSALYAAPEIQKIESMIADGTFDASAPLADSLADGVRPRNKPAQKTTPFSTVNEREGLMDLARARSPKLIASAVAGKGRGLAFPDDTPIETLVQYNQDVMAAIVDDGGQIPILRELGIPHEIEESAGTFTGYEPSIMIRLLGGNLETANKLAPLLGDALLQDSVITSQAVYGEAGLPAFVVVKKDGSDFSRADAMALAESMNPSKDPEGINFNQPMNDTLMFLDSRSMKDGFEYTELNSEEFYSTLANELGDGYSIGVITTQGDYHGSDKYREAIEKAWNRETPSGSSNIYDRTNASLYEPVRKVYNEYAEKLGIPKRETKELGPLLSPPSSDRLQRARDMGFDTDRVFYHGTDQQFDSFSGAMRGSVTSADSAAEAVFFSSRKKTAQSYSRGRNPNLETSRRLGGTPRVIEAYLKLQNPFIVDMKNSGFKDARSTAILKQAKEAGHDGVIFQRYYDYNSSVQGRIDSFLTRGVLSGEDIVAVFNTNQIRSVDAQFDPAKAESSNILYSPPSRTYDEVNAARNAEIREEKGKVDKASSWIKKTFKRQLTSRGLLNEQVFQAKIARDGEFGAAEIDTRMYLNSYDKAVKDANLSEEQTALLSEAIATPLDQLNSLNLPDAVKQAIGGMRKYLDKMSIDYAQVVADQASALVESGKGDAAAAKIDLLNTIASNKGKYLNRSYQVFDDPKWANKVPKPVIDNARTFLEANGAQNADRIINTILKTGTAFDSLSSFISEGKLGSKDLSILKKRKDIAPEILALMGEYTDPRINFVKTATKVSRLLWNHKFLERVKLEGQRDGFLFTAEDAPTDAYVQIAPDSSDAMNPLNGLYTTPELAQGFEDAMDLGSNVEWVKKWQQLNSVVKYGKTVIAPTTVARNFMSASLFTVANGHFNWAKGGESLKSLRGFWSDESSYFDSAEGASTAYLREIRRHGVIYDSPYAGELTKALEDFSRGTELDNKVKAIDGTKDKIAQKSKSFLDLAAKFYQYGDDFWKIIGFENMVDVLMDNKGLTREQAVPLAAERIRDTYPTYSLIGKGVADLRRFPMVGTFVSFPAEIIRTSFNMFKYLKQDMADPDMRGHAMTKVAGMSAVSLGIYALQDAAMRAFDVDEEEQEAIRLMSPTWSENSNILPTGRDDDGNLEYIDLTYLDPYAYFKKPINALMRDQPTEDAIVQAGRELLTPFLGVDIATGAVLELYNNEKVSGGRIWNPADTPTNKLSAATEHLIKGAGPAVIQNVTRTAKAINGDVSKSGKRYELEDELKAWVGFRVTTFDPKVSLHFKAYEFNEDKRNASSLLTSTFRDPNQLEEGELINAFERASAARKEGYERMIKLVSAARKSGLNNTQLMMVLRSNGVTKKDAKALIAGNPATWEMSDSTLKNSIKKSDLLFGDATGREFEKRWLKIQELLRGETQ